MTKALRVVALASALVSRAALLVSCAGSALVSCAGSALVSCAGSALVSCAGSAPDPRYPSREAGCPVKSFPAEPTMPVDDLGTVAIDCAPASSTSPSGASRGGCERQALDVVCARGGDVAWGFADNALTSTRLVVHAAHTRRALEAARPRGCVVQVFIDAPPIATENIGAVIALCSPDDSRDTCLRELEDQVCKLGGNVLWQVEGPTPADTPEGSKQRMRGRAAHTR
jgi:hypothetical protein